MRVFRLTGVTWAIVASGLCLPPGVAARDGNVFELTISENLSYDDNLYRLAPDSPAERLIGTERRDDLASVTTVVLGADKAIGRQSLYGNYRHGLARYQIHKSANYDTDDGLLGWRGAFGTANRWDIYAKRAAVQSDYADGLGYTRNIATTDTAHAGLDLRFKSALKSEFIYEQSRQRNDSPSRNGGDYDGRMGAISLGYWPASANGIEARYARSEQEYIGGRIWRQNDVGLTGILLSSPASKFEGSTGVQIQRSASGQDSRRGRLSLRHTWRPPGASTFSLRVLREKTNPSSSAPVLAETWGGAAQWTWQPTAHLQLDSSVDYRKRHYDIYQEPGSNLSIDRREYVRLATLSGTWFVTPNLQLSLSARNDKRDANHIRYNYDSQSYWLALQYVY